MMKSFPCYESITEEPIAGNPHDGFCEEESAQWGAFLTRRGVWQKYKIFFLVIICANFVLELTEIDRIDWTY